LRLLIIPHSFHCHSEERKSISSLANTVSKPKVYEPRLAFANTARKPKVCEPRLAFANTARKPKVCEPRLAFANTVSKPKVCEPRLAFANTVSKPKVCEPRLAFARHWRACIYGYRFLIRCLVFSMLMGPSKNIKFIFYIHDISFSTPQLENK